MQKKYLQKLHVLFQKSIIRGLVNIHKFHGSVMANMKVYLFLVHKNHVTSLPDLRLYNSMLGKSSKQHCPKGW